MNLFYECLVKQFKILFSKDFAVEMINFRLLKWVGGLLKSRGL